MNADQKKRIAHEISNWKNACNCRAVQLTGDRMAALLQGLIDAPEEIVPAELPAWENGDDPLIGGGLISRGVVDFASLGIWPGKPAPDVEPVAYVTGYNNGYPTIAPINSALCMAIGTALYSAPQPPKLSDERILELAARAEAQWNAVADQYNKWGQLGFDEIVILISRAIEREILGGGE